MFTNTNSNSSDLQDIIIRKYSSCFNTRNCFLLTYLLSQWSRVFLKKLTGSQLVNKFSTFYGTRRFITAFTSTRSLSLSWARSNQSMPTYFTSWRFIVILSSYLYLGLPSCLSPSCFPNKTLYAPLPSPIRATFPTHLILLDLISRKIFGEQYRSLSSSLCSFLYSTVTFSLLGPNILLKTLFSVALNQVPHPYKQQAQL
jgi:hypothetical protein